MKTNKEIIHELVDLIAGAISKQTGASTVMLAPALNIIKLKTAQMSEQDGADIIDKVHWLSHHIEKESGQLSPYHGIENFQAGFDRGRLEAPIKECGDTTSVQ
jgi:hypothetical protein